MQRLTVFASGLLLAALSTAAAQTLADREIPYRLGYNDVVTLTYRYTPEFSQDVTIGPDGRAQVAGLGSVSGLGLTLDDFKEKLITLSSTRLVSPDLTLTLKTSSMPSPWRADSVRRRPRIISSCSATSRAATGHD
jgi:polysaccharide export outer membrane protein